MNIRHIDFPNIGYSEFDFREEELFPLKQEIIEIQQNNFNAFEWNSQLAGNIEKQFLIEKNREYLEKLMLPLCGEANKKFQILQDIKVLTKDAPLVLENAWINFQKKGEFNPIHHHSGVFSFVIWIDIPYNIEDEMNVDFAKKSNTKSCGVFEFLFTDTLGKIKTYKILADNKFKNRGILFPSKMNHGVYPFFTSNDYRISISGNLILDNS